ncbi:MAG: alanine racemase [Flavobacteriales bacterium]|nr:alanine racemase [Flavobacteriales bacterium]
MNLRLDIETLCSVTQGEFIGDPAVKSDLIIQNIIIDSRSPLVGENTLFITLEGKKDDGLNFVDDFCKKGGKLIIGKSTVSTEVAQIIVSNPLTALQEIARFHRSKFNIPVIGITGSNGKTVVKEWLYHCLRDRYNIVRSPKSYNSQIGVPLSVLQLTEQHELAIFEAGISQPGEMERLERIIQPSLGIFTGLGDAHSANFISDEEKKSEKFKLFRSVEKLIENNGQFDRLQIPFEDEASQSNAQLVKQTALHLGHELSFIEPKLATLPSISMRMEQIPAKGGCLILNDAYSSDLQSLEIALKHIEQFNSLENKVLFLTPFEDNKRGEELIDLLSGAHLNEIVLIGDEADLAYPKHLKVHHYPNVEAYLQKPLRYKNSLILFKGSRKIGLERIVKVYAEKKHISRLIIDFNAIRHNLNYYKDHLEKGTMVLAMVKAQSYGSGITEMAHFLAGEKVNYFGVAYADEGVEIRKSRLNTPIIVMNPEPNALDDIIEYSLEPSIYSIEALQEFIHELILKQRSNYPIHIKLNTGMNRLGFNEDELAELISVLQTQPEVYVKSIFSHLSSADDTRESEFTFGQIRKFEIMSGMIKDQLGYPVIRHIANSAATLNYRQSHFDMIRMGIGLFGLVDAKNKSLENALSLKSRISQINLVKQGESVGYGRSFIAEEDMTIGVVPIGYADGLRRELSKGVWSVIINGKNAPIVGNICMDMCMVDLSRIDAKRGDDVLVFGKENSIYEMAQLLNTIPYEIISSISSRVFRIYLDD